jgi:hypothetical protein
MRRCQARCAVNAGTHRSIPSSPKPMLSESRTPYAPINPSFVPEPLAVFPSSYNSVGAPTDLPVPHRYFPYSSSLLVQFLRPLHCFPQISHLGTATSCSYSKESKGRNWYSCDSRRTRIREDSGFSRHDTVWYDRIEPTQGIHSSIGYSDKYTWSLIQERCNSRSTLPWTSLLPRNQLIWATVEDTVANVVAIGHGCDIFINRIKISFEEFKVISRMLCGFRWLEQAERFCQ